MTNKNIFRVVFVILTVILMAVIAPLIWAAASAGIGLIVLGIIGLVGFGIIQLIPYLGQKLENNILKLRKSEARNNPIEQLQNFLSQKSQQVYDFKSAVSNIGAQILSLEDMIVKRKKERPNYDATNQERSIQAMKSAHGILKEKYINAEKALIELKTIIQDKEFEWKFSQAGQIAMKNLNSTNGKELMEAMLADEAFSSVTDNFNRVFADLELEAKQLTQANELKFDSDMTLDISNINLEKVRV